MANRHRVKPVSKLQAAVSVMPLPPGEAPARQLLNARLQEVRKIQRKGVRGYERDFGEYSGRWNSLNLQRVFRNVPRHRPAAWTARRAGTIPKTFWAEATAMPGLFLARGRSEAEFLYRTGQGDIVPVEIKSGTRARVRSLGGRRERYRPECP